VVSQRWTARRSRTLRRRLATAPNSTIRGSPTSAKQLSTTWVLLRRDSIVDVVLDEPRVFDPLNLPGLRRTATSTTRVRTPRVDAAGSFSCDSHRKPSTSSDHAEQRPWELRLAAVGCHPGNTASTTNAICRVHLQRPLRSNDAHTQGHARGDSSPTNATQFARRRACAPDKRCRPYLDLGSLD
jgi:hypothetical protein